ncbi:MAG TPA: hypothetical protein VFK17_08490 [Gaiellaceae bacterium]|nr:hypothetical protein [Gaiellaceae bacterium]
MLLVTVTFSVTGVTVEPLARLPKSSVGWPRLTASSGWIWSRTPASADPDEPEGAPEHDTVADAELRGAAAAAAKSPELESVSVQPLPPRTIASVAVGAGAAAAPSKSVAVP